MQNESEAANDILKLPEDQKKLALRLTAEIAFVLEKPKLDLIERIRANGIVGYKINDDGSIVLKYSESAQIQLEILEASLRDLFNFAMERALDIVLERLK